MKRLTKSDKILDRQHNSVYFHVEFFNWQKYIPDG